MGRESQRERNRRKTHRKAMRQEDVAAAKKAIDLLKGAPHLTPEAALRIVGGSFSWPNVLQILAGAKRRR